MRERRVGVRTLELDQRPDPEEPGTRFFRFVLNGVGIFARGANWIPADSFVGAVAADRYERLIEDARDAHMNMLRVWGGGIYEHDVFYDLCDRLGVLVWQDFMFSCATYPEAPLAAEVELEARAQVARLGGHPSLALWCGNNENQWIHDMQFPERGGERVPGALFYDEILPRVGRGARPAHALLARARRSAATTTTRAQEGDAHNWEVWHGQSRRRFGEPRARRPDAGAGRVHPLRGGRGALHLGVRRARRARPRDAAALDPRRPALPPQPGDGPPHQGHAEEQDRHAARVGHGRRRRPRRVRRLLDDRPGRGAEVRHRALPPPRTALLGRARLAAQRLLAGAELGAARLPRLRQGGLLRRAARVRAGARARSSSATQSSCGSRTTPARR